MAAARLLGISARTPKSLIDLPQGVDFEASSHYYEYVRENDLALTHALTNPQVNRSLNASEFSDPYIALGVVRKNAKGIVVRGARMMATLPLADEILILTSDPQRTGASCSLRFGFCYAHFHTRSPFPVPRIFRHEWPWGLGSSFKLEV